MNAYIFSVIFSFTSLLMAYEVRVNAVDETGAPVVGAAASVYFLHPREDDQRSGLTDAGGLFSAKGSGTLGVGVMAQKPGHYSARIDLLSKNSDHQLKLVLPRVLNPTPLYAWRTSGWMPPPAFPVHGAWCGFDFEAADWVAPHGRGKTADILFRFKNEFKGWDEIAYSRGLPEKYFEELRKLHVARNEEFSFENFKIIAGRWDGVLEISFPGEGGGILEEKGFLAYSKLKMPHMAPADGYVSGWRYTSNNYSPRTYRDDVGFFLRTRVKLDKDGKVVSANYAKVVRDLRLDAAIGAVAFAYYFNPTPNDRNLEFDPKKNLFPKDTKGTEVYDP
jgi:hypothetical protein